MAIPAKEQVVFRNGLEVDLRWRFIVRYCGVLDIQVKKKMRWDLLAQIGRDGQHLAKNIDQHPTAHTLMSTNRSRQL